MPARKISLLELERLRQKNPNATQEELAEMLGASPAAVCKNLKALDFCKAQDLVMQTAAKINRRYFSVMDRHDRNADIVSGELEYLERKIPLAIGEEREKLVRSHLDHIAEDRKLCAAKVDAAKAMVHIDQVMAWHWPWRTVSQNFRRCKKMTSYPKSENIDLFGRLLERLTELSSSTGPKAPCKFVPRGYKQDVLTALENGIKRVALVWHRRSGKDLTALHWIGRYVEKRPGVYYHLLPTFTQAKRIIWDGRDDHGRPFLNYLPQDLIARKNETELKVLFKNGSIYQLIGTDNFDSIVGPNPQGVIFSEFSLQNPKSWDLIRPILAENEGWSIFCYTPRGRNHAWELYEAAKKDPERWFTQLLTIDQTQREDGSPVITRVAVEKEIADGMNPDLAEQEFYCSWNAPQVGSYYSKLLEQTEKEKRIGKVPWESTLPVDTFWDLGVGDSTAIWFVQAVAQELRVIDYLEASGEGLPYYKKELDEKPYSYGRHHGPTILRSGN